MNIITLNKPSVLKYGAVLLVFLGWSAIAFSQDTLAKTQVHEQQNVNETVPRATPIGKRAERKQLMRFLKSLNFPEVDYNESDDNQWRHLAALFTRLRLYPLAMKCFLKTLSPDSLVNSDIPITNSDQQNIQSQLIITSKEVAPIKSNIIKVDSILEKFKDGKKALSYALILHVKQAVRGTPRVHKFIYTGHTFITLIKFNTDSSYASFTFGFGPHKDNLLAATPIIPSSSSKFTDDGTHNWDEVVGKFISKRRFERILKLTKQYDGLTYNLNSNNCTDFGLKAARLGGLEVRETKGYWPLGAGNNPGVTGKSILLGKFNNMDTGNFEKLFIDTARIAPIEVTVH